MGLDIIAYSDIDKIDKPMDGKEYRDKYGRDPDIKTTLLYEFFFDPENWDFQQQLRGLEPGVYSYDNSVSFRAGSYSGYNRWRNWLSVTMIGVSADQVWYNPIDYQYSPFYELINFSDCEGYIGTEVSKKLAEDFRNNRSKVPQGDLDLYDEWMHAFELASNNGVVIFC